MPFLHFVFIVLSLTKLCSAQNATISPTRSPTTMPTIFFTTIEPTRNPTVAISDGALNDAATDALAGVAPENVQTSDNFGKAPDGSVNYIQQTILFGTATPLTSSQETDIRDNLCASYATFVPDFDDSLCTVSIVQATRRRRLLQLIGYEITATYGASSSPTQFPSNNPTTSMPTQSPVSPTNMPTMNPTAPPRAINVSSNQSGVIGSASALTFELSLFDKFESVTISGCDAVANQFNTTFTVQDASGNVVPTQRNACPGNPLQSQVVISNAAAGVYDVTLSGLDESADPSTDTWAISVSSVTFAPTPSPTESRSDSDSGSGSGSGSGSDSSDDASILSAFSFGANNDAVNVESNGDGEEQYEMMMSFSSATLVNMWLIAGVCVVVNVLGFCMCRNKVASKTY